MLTNDEGIKNGEIRLGPLFSQTMEFFSIFGKPPIPDADTIPHLSLMDIVFKIRINHRFICRF